MHRLPSGLPESGKTSGKKDCFQVRENQGILWLIKETRKRVKKSWNFKDVFLYQS